jgi:hypothetical protein
MAIAQTNNIMVNITEELNVFSIVTGLTPPAFKRSVVDTYPLNG